MPAADDDPHAEAREAMKRRTQALAAALLEALEPNPDQDWLNEAHEREKEARDVALLTHFHAKTQPSPPRTPIPHLHARSPDEITLYLHLNPCPCGQPAAPPSISPGQPTRYEIPCTSCDLLRTLDFTVEPTDTPSRLICPGQYALHADTLADPHAIAHCIDELTRFLPDTAPAIPRESFTSYAGRKLYLKDPTRFTRPTLAAWRQSIGALR